MSTHRHIGKVCAAAAAVCLAAALALMAVSALFPQAEQRVLGYESRLLDPSRVHTIAIVMEDWEGFLSTCEGEEYVPCDLVIDGESSKSVGIRAKGNTSLQSVSRLGSSRYSFKIEFDHYVSGKSYYGLDKLSLNNLIQDNTYLKDYLTYRMMNAFSVDGPLCSFVFLTVNGEDWGLYLAAEGVEDGFLQRTKGGSGQLYKPDSMDMGGGRGNGADFSASFFDQFDQSDQQEGGGEGQTPQFSFDRHRSGRQDLQLPETGGETSGDPSSGGQFPFGDDSFQRENGDHFGGRGGFSAMGGSEVKLQYIDDDPSSYSAIFSSAKTPVTGADQTRLIASLRQLSAGENLEEVLDMDLVLRYFVVHSFVVNGDSYTGSLIHNYYLYENEGRLSMIPWDYNLAFGTFQGQASSAVNDPIDEALSDRPMQAWIFSGEDYTQRYHQLYAEFLRSVDWESMIDQAAALIAPYVERDPTRFCTYEDFQTGVEALKRFCALRSESVFGQLSGEIPATSADQSGSSALIDTGGLDLSQMGDMSSTNGGFGGRSDRQTPDGTGTDPFSGENPFSGTDPFSGADPFSVGGPDAVSGATPNGAEPQPSDAPALPGESGDGQFGRQNGWEGRGFDGQTPDGLTAAGQASVGGQSGQPALLLALSAGVLAAGLAMAFFLFRRR